MIRKQPNKQVTHLNSELRRISNRLIDNAKIDDDSLKELIKEIYIGYVCDIKYGETHYNKQYFTVPLWAHKKGTQYFTYYIAHELSHAFSQMDDYMAGSHCKNYYKMFKAICPEHLQYLEYKYKPRQAKKYGVKINQTLITETI